MPALVKMNDDIWLRPDLIVSVERNATTGSIEVTYIIGTNLATATLTGVKLDDVVAKFQPSEVKR